MIARSTSQTENIDEWRRKFPTQLDPVTTTIVVESRQLPVHIATGMNGAEYVGVFDGENLIAMVNTWSSEEPLPDRRIGGANAHLPYRNIAKTIVHPAYQGNSITRQLIEWWVQTHQQCLASDENQTDDGARVWESMIIRNPKLRFSLWRPDGSETDLIVEAEQITPDPWAEHHSRLLARP